MKQNTKQSLQKFVHWTDGLILLLALWIFHDLDFSNLALFDKVYLATFGIWFLLFALRIVILLKKKFTAGE